MWERLFERLLDLHDALNLAMHLGCRPESGEGLHVDAKREWRRLEARHISRIHAAVRELMRTGGLADDTPDMLYF